MSASRAIIPVALKKTISSQFKIRAIDDNIYSVYAHGEGQAHYDRRAAIYDLIVGMNSYHRITWGNVLPDYFSFATDAVLSSPSGLLLDAGCGSLLFTGRAYGETQREIVALDALLEMLKRARTRLTSFKGVFPENVFLVQGDLDALPFRRGCFDTILSMHVLHVLKEIPVVLSNLRQLLKKSGKLYATSAVKAGNLRDSYLHFLHGIGEFASPRSVRALDEILRDVFPEAVTLRTKGNMAYITALAGPDNVA